MNSGKCLLPIIKDPARPATAYAESVEILYILFCSILSIQSIILFINSKFKRSVFEMQLIVISSILVTSMKGSSIRLLF